MSNRLSIAFAAAVTALAPVTVSSQPYPAKPI